jgi:membrane fusion protein (multidrug efflux system)
MAEVLEKERDQEVQRKGGALTAVKWAVALVVIAGLAYAGFTVWQQLSREESTDDAQIDGTITPVSSRISGHVATVLVGDEQEVKTGQVLAELDKKDFEVALAKAQADLADAEAALEGARNDVPVATAASNSGIGGARSGVEDATATVSFSEQQVGAAKARMGMAQANVRVAEANQSKAAQDVERYKVLVAKDEISKQMYDQAVAAASAAGATVEAQRAGVLEAQQNVAAGEKAVEQARARLLSAEAILRGAESGPEQVKSTEARAVAAAARVGQHKAEVEQAQLNLSYTTISAPADGIVGRKALEVGQNISMGQQLMSIVSLDDIWVTANFKETQLKDMRVGQPVNVEVDATGRTYSGKVERIGGASSARFSLLPPENATGNYVRVVQRVPVRISIDPGQNQDHALRPGISANPKVQIR